MKLIRLFVLLGVLCFVGCGAPDAGVVGDQNDPAAPGGSDEAQDSETMDEGGEEEESGDVE